MTVTEFRRAMTRIPGNGWLTDGEALLLVDYASRTTGGIVEIGCHEGKSACLLLQLKHRDKGGEQGWNRNCCFVDPWGDFALPGATGDEVFSRFVKNLSAIDNVFPFPLIFRQRVEDWEPTPAGFVYCDGDHTYEGTLAQVRKALACDPQVIATHDVNDEGGGRHVKRACLELLGPWTERVERLAVWEIKKCG